MSTLHEIIKEAWKTAVVPQDWKDAQLITIFKIISIVINYCRASLFPYRLPMLQK